MIRLDSYKIEGYKNIGTANITLNNFNVIIGPNNSGKSNFIQSISFLHFLINAPTDDLERYFKTGFRQTYFGDIIPVNSYRNTGKDFKNTMKFELNFSNTETDRRFEYSLEILYEVLRSKGFEQKYNIQNESLSVKESGKPGSPIRVFSRKDGNVTYGTDIPRHGLLDSYPNYLSVIRILKIFSFNRPDYTDAVNCLNQILKTPIFYFSHTELSKKREGNDRLNILNGRIVAFDLEEEIIKLEQSESWPIFKSSLNNILGIDEVIVARFTSDSKEGKTERKALLFRHANYYKILTELSDGTILLVALITKILNTQNDIFFIEEPENSTHPKALVDLINFINSFLEKKQFIITSHSIVLLNKSKIENIITSCINESGQSEIFNVISKRELKNRLKSGYNNFSDELFFGNNDSEEFE